MRGSSVLSNLIYAAYDGTITDEQMAKLNSMLLNSKEARDYYYEYMEIIAGAGFICSDETFIEKNICPLDNMLSVDKDILSILVEEENNASSVYIEKEEEPTEVLEHKPEKAKGAGTGGKPGKLYYFYNAVFSTAAALLIFFIIYANMFPARPVLDVATVIDQIDTVWSGSSEKLANGERVFTHMNTYVLESGIIKIKYDQGVDVVIEGPARFELERLGMYMDYGKLYSYVSKVGYGFTVDSPNSRFVDLGTEFGVDVDRKGSSELHVLTGQVQLYAGEKGKDKVTFTASKDSAWRYDAISRKVDSIAISSNKFARNIDSGNDHIWRGESRIDLADICGGGDGLGTGLLGSGINPYRGEYVESPILINFKQVESDYALCSDSKYVDGTFVPNGADGAVVINSSGYKFDGFKANKGDFRSSFMNGPAIRDREKYPNYKNGVDFYLMDLALDGVVYGTKENPAIYSHTSSGITFDLNEIRKAYPQRKIARFETTMGVPDRVRKYVNNRDIEINFDLYIFADNECIYTKTLTGNTPIESLELELPEDSRFMTIAVVDSDKVASYEWCIFGRPELVISD